jgi:hypothetical protein
MSVLVIRQRVAVDIECCRGLIFVRGTSNGRMVSSIASGVDATRRAGTADSSAADN